MDKQENIESLISRFRYFESFGLTFADALKEMNVVDTDGCLFNAWIAAVILNKDAE